jgi:hypothetical protein
MTNPPTKTNVKRKNKMNNIIVFMTTIMKNRIAIFMAVICAVVLMLPLWGCGGGSSDNQPQTEEQFQATLSDVSRDQEVAIDTSDVVSEDTEVITKATSLQTYDYTVLRGASTISGVNNGGMLFPGALLHNVLL